MKTTTKITITFIIAFYILSLSVGAHPGRTDSNGGHWDREVGTYHYHSGEYAGKKHSGSSSSSSPGKKTFNFKIKKDENPFKKIIKPEEPYYAGECYEFKAELVSSFSNLKSPSCSHLAILSII